jgi:hypothetical protein
MLTLQAVDATLIYGTLHHTGSGTLGNLITWT